MLIERFSENPIIKPSDVPPSRDDYEVVGAFNPAATIFNNEILLLLRVAERPKDKNPDEQVAPILNPDTGEIEHFRVKNDDPNITDIPDSRSFCQLDQPIPWPMPSLRQALVESFYWKAAPILNPGG
jgi:predicted GH43/DUF377 family glycosyl hydrolase